MGLSNLGAGASNGLLRGLLNTKTESPTQTAGFQPAIAALNKEPLSRTPPPGTSQIVANKPALDMNSMQEQLQSMPVPNPEEAAQLIQAMVTPPPVASSPSVPQQPQAQTYVVRGGDTLSRIAQRFGVNPGAITGYRSGNPNLIYPGEVLTIGGGRAVAPTPQPQVLGTTSTPISYSSFMSPPAPVRGRGYKAPGWNGTIGAQPSRYGSSFNVGGALPVATEGASLGFSFNPLTALLAMFGSALMNPSKVGYSREQEQAALKKAGGLNR